MAEGEASESHRCVLRNTMLLYVLLSSFPYYNHNGTFYLEERSRTPDLIAYLRLSNMCARNAKGRLCMYQW